MNLLPMIQPEIAVQSTRLPLYQEVAWDYKSNRPVWRGGSPIIVIGAQAVLSWAYRALQTPRYRYAVYTWNYGNECESLIGTSFSEELKQAEAARYVKECLLANPYISDVKSVSVSFSDQTLAISCTLETPYGEVVVNV